MHTSWYYQHLETRLTDLKESEILVCKDLCKGLFNIGYRHLCTSFPFHFRLDFHFQNIFVEPPFRTDRWSHLVCCDICLQHSNERRHGRLTPLKITGVAHQAKIPLRVMILTTTKRSVDEPYRNKQQTSECNTCTGKLFSTLVTVCNWNLSRFIWQRKKIVDYNVRHLCFCPPVDHYWECICSSDYYKA